MRYLRILYIISFYDVLILVLVQNIILNTAHIVQEALTETSPCRPIPGISINYNYHHHHQYIHCQ